MKFKCVECDCMNQYLRCHMCKKWFPFEGEECKGVICPECERECEQLYIETVNKKHSILIAKEKRELQLKNLPEKYKNLIIDFDGF